MSHHSMCGLALGLMCLLGLQVLAFVPVQPSKCAPVLSHAVQAASLRGTGCRSSVSSPSVTNSAAAQLALAGMATILAACGARAIHRSGQKQQQGRTLKVATRALGSIDQFKVFGPTEDPFVIETDKVLGVGGQGTVYLCHRQSNPGIKYAVKTIPIWRLLMDPSSEQKIKEIRKETDVLLRIQGHPNVCECIGCYDAFRPGTSQAQYIMIVMEKIEGGELAGYIKDGRNYLAEDVAQSVTKQTIAGLKYIHSKQVLHRDLKAENILVCSQQLTKDTQVKLIDFGVAKNISAEMAKSCVGTTEIMAPELVSAKLMMMPKGVVAKKHGPFKFKSPAEASPGFGIISQRPDGKGAMINGIQPGGQAEAFKVADGWAIFSIDGINITEMPFVKDFNELGAGTMGGVSAIAQILQGLSGPFDVEFVELPKRQFSEKVDIWSLGVVLYTMLAGVTPFKNEDQIVNGEYEEGPLAHCSPAAKDLIKKVLVLDPTQRLTLDQMLAHPWLA